MLSTTFTLKRAAAALAVAAVSAMALASVAVAVETLTQYRNKMSSAADRAEMVKVGGGRCHAGGSDSALRLRVGKKTRECAYRTPVIGRDLDLTATARLFKDTPKGIQKRVYVSLSLRTGKGGRYMLAVFPRQRKFQLRKVLPGGKVRYLAHGRSAKKIKGMGEANRLKLRAFNETEGAAKGTARLLAIVNGHSLAVLNDRRGGEFEGRESTVSIGSRKSSRGAGGSFDNVTVKSPSPF